jgi:hypothetical protein
LPAGSSSPIFWLEIVNIGLARIRKKKTDRKDYKEHAFLTVMLFPELQARSQQFIFWS